MHLQWRMRLNLHVVGRSIHSHDRIYIHTTMNWLPALTHDKSEVDIYISHLWSLTMEAHDRSIDQLVEQLVWFCSLRCVASRSMQTIYLEQTKTCFLFFSQSKHFEVLKVNEEFKVCDLIEWVFWDGFGARRFPLHVTFSFLEFLPLKTLRDQLNHGILFTWMSSKATHESLKCEAKTHEGCHSTPYLMN